MKVFGDESVEVRLPRVAPSSFIGICVRRGDLTQGRCTKERMHHHTDTARSCHQQAKGETDSGLLTPNLGHLALDTVRELMSVL